MKKYLLFLLIAVSVFNSYCQLQHAPGYRNTSIEVQYWNSANNNWISDNNSKDSFYYHVTDTLSYYDIDKSLNTANNTYSNNLFQSFYTYTTFGKEQNRIEQQWNTAHSAWWNVDQYFFTYDNNNNQVNETQQLWDTSRTTWVNYYRRLDTFDLNHNNIHFLQQDWDTVSSSWKNRAQSQALYDNHNNDTLLIIQNWDTIAHAWINSTKDVHQYDNANRQTEDIQQIWNKTISQWVNKQKLTFTYNPTGNITQLTTFYWNFIAANSGWDSTGRTLYTYNGSNQLASIADQYLQYTGFGHQWTNQDKIYYYYDGIGNVIQTLFQIYFTPLTPTDFLRSNYTWALAAGTLPVALTDFSGKAVNSTSQLQWKTSSEINTDHFEMQRSADGNNFILIGSVLANGTSSLQHSYAFIDNSPNPNAINYYRLKQVDKDGKFSYSKIVAINFYEKPFIQIFPNPASDHVFINVRGSGNYQIKLFDVNSKILSAKTYSNSAAPINIPLNNYSSGIYFIEVRDALDNIVTQQKIVKQ